MCDSSLLCSLCSQKWDFFYDFQTVWHSSVFCCVSDTFISCFSAFQTQVLIFRLVKKINSLRSPKELRAKISLHSKKMPNSMELLILVLFAFSVIIFVVILNYDFSIPLVINSVEKPRKVVLDTKVWNGKSHGLMGLKMEKNFEALI